jgi:hypothetical protein
MNSQSLAALARAAFTRLVLCAVLSVLSLCSASAQTGVCPAVGQDTGCGVIITINDTGPAQISFTGQGPFDGIEDTLVGVINNSSVPVASITLYSALPIFAFDGDGLTSYGFTNALDSSGYGGPNAYFTTTGGGSGTVNFITPLAPHVGTTFFSALACPDYLNNGLSSPTPNGADISASFTPIMPVPLAPSLTTAAQACGFSNLQWQQTVVNLPSPSPFRQNVNGQPKTLVAPPAFLDPPYGGYFGYGFPTAQYFPFYPNQITNNGGTINFFDSPGDSCLFGGDGSTVCGTAANGKPLTAPRGAKIAFKTRLLGALPSFTGTSASNCVSNGSCIDLGIGFDWTSDNNNNAGGAGVGGVYSVLTAMTSTPLGPGSVGATVTAFYPATTYNSVGVTAVNGNKPGTLPTLTSGGACDGAFSGSFVGDIHVSRGQTCSLIDMFVTGSVGNEGGSLTLTGTAITGGVSVEGGTVAISAYSSVGRGVSIENISALTKNVICNSTIYGSVEIEGGAGDLQVGGLNGTACTGNVIGRNLEVERTAGRIIVDNNIATGELECERNSSIFGEGNTASEKGGQCRSF